MNEVIEYDKAMLRYVLGGVLAGLATLVVYCAVTYRWLEGPLLAGFALLVAGVQLIVHLFFFLHMDREVKPKWNVWSLAFTILTALIVILGSLWIMMNLNYNMRMSPEQMNDYMIKQGKKGF